MRCQRITKHFGAAEVLSGVDLDVPVGESLAVMGPSGSGKSTLLALFGLLATPSAGELYLFGQPAPLRSAERTQLRTSRIAWVFQRAALLMARSVLDNVAVPLVLQGLPRAAADARAVDYVTQMGLGPRLHAPARLLSGGEQQRLEIARALARRVSLLLCDEPTAALDRANADLVIDLLTTHKPAETTLVVATHDPVVARRCATRVELRNGRAYP